MATILPEVSIDGTALTEIELINLEKSFVNMLREIFASTTGGIFSYKIGEKSIDRVSAINHLMNGIAKIKEWKANIPSEEYLTQDYEIGEWGDDLNEYIGDTF